MKLLCFSLLTLLACGTVFSQQKTLHAVKTDQPPRIDAKLDDVAWQSAPLVTEFIQNFPEVGKPSSVKSEVRILYDNSAIYVGAMLYDDPKLIRKQLTARDGEQQSDVDYFSVFFDTYKDKQNGYQFLVTTANVQTDAKLGTNLGGGFLALGDKTWDAVWESETSMTDSGWIVELKIPYISLRFAKKDLQDWGLQFQRFTRRNNETSYWNAVDPNVNGFVNQFGEYVGLKDIEPPLRLSFSPYVSTGIRSTPEKDGYNTEWLRNGGMDVKWGINESFTLDATLIPDFGQVVSDNVVNNLSPFEIRFTENRPFFTEGTELFNKAGLFYSRRVGATPPGFYFVRNLVNTDPNLEIVKNPSVTQLYNAIKFSGRNRQKLGIGIFNAITAPSKAIIKNKTTSEETRIQTSPLTNYNIIVLDQALKNQSYITFTNTNVTRNSSARDANVSALDFSFFDKSNNYNLKGTARYSTVMDGTNYDGFSSSLRFGKVSGLIQYYTQGSVESDQYDPNDLGFLLSPNRVTYTGRISYNQFNPTKNFLLYNYSLTGKYGWLYKPYRFTDLQLNAEAFWVFKNFWDLSVSVGSLPFGENDYFVLRTPGRHVKRPPFSYLQFEGSSDSRKKLFYSFDFLLAGFHIPEEHNYHVIQMGLRYRFSNKLSMDLSARREAETDFIVYAGREISDEPIIGFVDFTDITAVLSGVYNFTPRLNLTMRARHNWSKVIYNRFANVGDDGKPVSRPFIPDQDENFNVFNLDAFMTWDFRLGSRVVLGWKNYLGPDEFVDGVANRKYFNNLGKSFSLRHGNELTVRVIYFLDYNQFRKKR